MKMLCCLELKILGVEKDGYARRKIGIKALKKTRLGVDYLRNRFHVAVRLFLLHRPMATWNLFVLYNDQERKKDRYTRNLPASYLLTVRGFVLV